MGVAHRISGEKVKDCLGKVEFKLYNEVAKNLQIQQQEINYQNKASIEEALNIKEFTTLVRDTLQDDIDTKFGIVNSKLKNSLDTLITEE